MFVWARPFADRARSSASDSTIEIMPLKQEPNFLLNR